MLNSSLPLGTEKNCQLLLPMQGPALAIHASDAVLDNMNDWCKEHHGKSGLTQRVRESKVSMAQAEEMVGAQGE